MDLLVEYLWDRRRIARHLHTERDLACALLECGIESDAILRLAGDGGLSGEEKDRLVEQAIREIGREELLDRENLLKAYEKQSVADYYAGRIDGLTLIARGCENYYEMSETGESRSFWLFIAADADQHGGQGICFNYPFNERPFDEVLKAALAENGLSEDDVRPK